MKQDHGSNYHANFQISGLWAHGLVVGVICFLFFNLQFFSLFFGLHV